MEQFTGIKKMNGLYSWLKKSKNLLRTALIFLLFISSGSAFSQLSYTQDFEGSHGWTGFSNTTINNPQLCVAGGIRYNLWAAATTASATSPLIGQSNAGSVTLSFDYQITDYGTGAATSGNFGTINVQYSSSTSGPWTTVATINSSNHISSATCATFNVPSFSPAAGNFYLRFDCSWSSGDYYINLDNVALSQGAAPACYAPSAFTQSNLTGTSVDIGWTTGGSTVWNYELVTAGTTPTGTGTSTTSNPLSLSNLMPQTTYNLYVQDDCSGTGNGVSVWSMYSFTTPCAPAAAPFIENFDGLALTSPFTALPACWEPQVGPDYWDVTNDITNTGHTYLPNIGDHTTGSGNYMWIDASSNITGNAMITPDIDMSTLNAPIAGFWFASNNLNNSVNHTINLDVWDGNAWLNIATESGNFSGWTEVVGNVPSGVPSITKFRIQAIADPTGTSSTYYFNDLGIDDFFVQEAPTCYIPTNLTNYGITTTTATIAWNTGGSGVWNYEVVAAGTTPTGVGTQTTSNPIVVTGLTQNTSYDFYVQDDCSASGNGTSAWAGPYTFTTVDPCPPVSNVTLNYAGEDTLIISWTSTNNLFNIVYDLTGFNPSTGGIQINGHSGTTLTVPNLSAQNTYDFYIQSDCAPDSSLLAGPYTFSTLGYCTPAPFSQDGSGIINVTYGTVNNSTGSEPGYYGDYTSFSSSHQQTSTVNVDITYSTGYTYGTKIWVDWNDDFDFNDAGEEVYYGLSTNNIPTILNASFTIPLTAPIGAHRMRIGGSDNDGGPTPCYTGSYATFEDYTLDVTAAPSCVVPSSVTFTNVTTSSIDVNISGASSTWEVEYGTAGFTQGTGTVASNVTGGVYNATGLNADVTYDFYVRADCGGGTYSAWAGPFSATTACAPLSSFPYNEDFESGATGWSIYGNNSSWAIGTPAGPIITAAANGSGAAVTNLTGDYNPGEFSYLQTPCMDFSNLSNPELSFSFIRDFENCCDEGWVEYTTDGMSWTKLGSASSGGTNWYNDGGNNWWDSDDFNWTTTGHSLSMLAGQPFVRLRFVMSADGSVQDDGMGIDDFAIFENPCPAITQFTLTAIGTTTADITFNSSASSIIVEYGLSGFAQGTGVVDTISTNTINITGLLANTTYDFYVYSNCGGGLVSPLSGPYSFTTLNNLVCATVETPTSANAYFESFETGLGSWVNPTYDNFNWTRDAFGTSSSPTGPSTGADGDYYMYTETSGPAVGSQAVFESPCFDISGLTDPIIQFNYHMYGSSMGTLALEMREGNGAWTQMWSMSGDQGDQWYQHFIDLSPYNNGDNVMFRFIMTVGGPTNYWNDAAIDAIYVGEAYEDLNVTNVYAFGTSSSIHNANQTISARIENTGTKNITNGTVNFAVTGMNSFGTSATFNLPVGADTIITVAGYSPLYSGATTITASVASDYDNNNNSATYATNVTNSSVSYAEPGVAPAGYVGFNGGVGQFVAKFNATIPTAINQVTVNFNSTGVNYRIGIYDVDANGAPGNLLFATDTMQTAPGAAIAAISPAVPVSGEFFVGVLQEDVTNVSFAYQNESPIRPNTFFYANDGTNWSDFAPNNPFRFMVEPRFQMPNDLAMVSIINDGSNCIGGPAQQGYIVIANYGSNAIDFAANNVDVNVTVVDPNSVTTNLPMFTLNSGTLASGARDTIMIPTTVNMTTPGTYQVNATLAYSIDDVQDNNTLLTAAAITTTVPPLDLGSDVTTCSGGAVTLNAFSAGSTYLWNDGSTFPTKTINGSGTYAVTVTGANGCISIDSVTYTIVTAFNTGTAAPVSLCDNGSIVNLYDAVSGEDQGGTWYDGNGQAVMSTNFNPATMAAGTYNYTYEFAAALGCAAQSTATSVEVIAAPSVDLGSNETVCAGESVSFMNTIGGNASDLFISEYAEGSSNNKYIEIYNGTGAAVDLSGYEIWTIANGGNWPEGTITLTGTVADGDVYVIANPSANAAILAEADMTSGSITFNGNDAIGLAKDNGSGTFELIDAFGDGSGVSWNISGVSNASTNHTVWRSSATCSPDTNWTAAQTNGSWSVSAGNDDWSDLGQHSNYCAPSNVAFAWSNGATTPMITVSTGGTYTVTMTETTNGVACSSTDQVQLVAYNNPVVAIDSVFHCAGQSSVVDAQNVGSTYAWSTTTSAQTETVSTQGTYSVTVTDLNNCSTAADFYVTEVVPSVAVTSTQDPTCGAVNGAITVAGSNAYGAVSYAWDDASNSTTATITGLASGTYNVTLTDAIGCTATTSATINDLGSPTVTITEMDELCDGDMTGSVMANATGGTGTLTYLWDDASMSTTAMLSGLGQGTYSVTVTDSIGCASSASGTVSFTNALPSINLGNDTNICSGETLTLDGGAGFTYSWSTTESTQTVDITTPGTVSVTITDVNTCSNSDAIVVGVDTLPAIDLGSDYNICADATTTLDAGAGYSYNWSTGSAMQTVTVGPGTMVNVTITDANGCSSNDMINIGTDTLPVVSLMDTTVCIGDTTMLDAGAGFTYAWSNSATSQTIDINMAGNYSVTITDGNGCSGTDAMVLSTYNLPNINLGNDQFICDGTTLTLNAGSNFTYVWQDGSTNSTYNVTMAGNYAVTITDGNTCSNSDDINITVEDLPVIMLPDTITVCADSSLVVDAGTGADWAVYNWSNGGGSQTITVTTPGTYVVTVYDLYVCSSMDTVEVVHNALPAINLGADTAICDGVTLTLNATSGMTTYAWSNGGSNASTDVTMANTYSVTITDGNGCTNADAIDVVVNALPQVSVADAAVCDGDSHTFDAGAGFASYSWSNGDNTQTISVSTDDTYSVTVTDANNCSNSTSAVLTVNALPTTTLADSTFVCNTSAATITPGAGFASYAWSTGNVSESILVTAANVGQTISVEVTDANGCSATDQTIVVLTPCASVQDVTNALVVSYYPNPTRGLVNFEIAGMQTSNVAVEIINNQGQVVLVTNLNHTSSNTNHQVDLSNVAKGVYFIRLTANNDASVHRLIIE